MLCLPFLLGANTISITKAVPNPGGNPNQVYGEGTCFWDTGSLFIGTIFKAKLLSNGQINSLTVTEDKTPTPWTWNGKLLVAPGIYDCFATLVYKDAKGMVQYQDVPTANWIKGVIVK